MPGTFVSGVLFCKLEGKYSVLWNIVNIFVNIYKSKFIHLLIPFKIVNLVDSQLIGKFNYL